MSWTLSNIAILRERAGAATIIIFTGHTRARRLDTEAIGVAAVLLKPANLDDLFDLIKNVLD